MKKTILLCCLICSVYGCKKESKVYPKTTLPGTTWRAGPITAFGVTDYLFIKFNSDTTVIKSAADIDDLNGVYDTLRCVIHIDNKSHMDTFDVYFPDGIISGSTTNDVNKILYGSGYYTRVN